MSKFSCLCSLLQKQLIAHSLSLIFLDFLWEVSFASCISSLINSSSCTFSHIYVDLFFFLFFPLQLFVFSKSHFWTVLALRWWLIKNHHLYNHYQNIIQNKSQLLQVIEQHREGQQHDQLHHNNLRTLPVFSVIFPWNFLFQLCITSYYIITLWLLTSVWPKLFFPSKLSCSSTRSYCTLTADCDCISGAGCINGIAIYWMKIKSHFRHYSKFFTLIVSIKLFTKLTTNVVFRRCFFKKNVL